MAAIILPPDGLLPFALLHFYWNQRCDQSKTTSHNQARSAGKSSGLSLKERRDLRPSRENKMTIYEMHCFNPNLLWQIPSFLILVAILYKLFSSLLTSFHASQSKSLVQTMAQKLQYLEKAEVKLHMIKSLPVEGSAYDLRISEARECLRQANTAMEHKNWSSAYRNLQAMRRILIEYNIGHIPPYEMPKPLPA